VNAQLQHGRRGRSNHDGPAVVGPDKVQGPRTSGGPGIIPTPLKWHPPEKHERQVMQRNSKGNFNANTP
jgi:hypothetical protein